MDHPVVAVADQDQIVDVGFAAVAPMHHVVGTGEGDRAIAARPFAASGPGSQRRSGRGTRQAERPADVDHRGVGSEEDAADARITGEALHRRRGDRAGELELAPERVVQTHHRLHRGGELEMAAPPACGGDRSEIQRMSGDLDQRVGEAAGQRSIVADTRASGQGEDGGLDGGRGDGVEVATQRHEPALAGNELAAVALGGGHMLLEDGGRVIGVTGTGAVVAEAADRVLAGQLQEWALVEGGRAGERCRG
jgi:hypothetical protein